MDKRLGESLMKVREFNVLPRLPAELKHLEELALNLYYSWNWDVVHLFIRLDGELWEKSYQNPVLMLGTISQEKLASAARDKSFIANLERVYAEMNQYFARSTWFGTEHSDAKGFQVAYFSCEFGLDEGVPIYSGGLGVLSGDHLKTASDLGLPLVGVGLLYQKGYGEQLLNYDGWQQERYPVNDWYNMPVTLETGPDGQPLTITVELEGEPVRAQIWRVQVGRTPLYLLDTSLRENPPRHREITERLYSGDRDMRIRQEIMLGVGGTRALAALGIEPTVYHMNEGHSAFLAVERLRRLVRDEGLPFDEAREIVWASNAFTTHTAVAAGNEVFCPDLVWKYFAPMADELGLAKEDFLDLGRDHSCAPGEFCMTVLALRLAAFTNGVSTLHGEVTRNMWQGLWPGLPVDEVPIRAISNGVHPRSWISHDCAELFERYLGPAFVEDPGDLSIWEHVETIPDIELWRMHEVRRERLVFFARKRLKNQLIRQGASAAAIRQADEVLNPQALTICFARRCATYKRPDLILRDPDRLIRLLNDPERPVQIVFAGKAHPQDNPAKELIRSIVHFANDPRVAGHIVFLENYDINVARYLVQGADVWLNTPRRPLEASGTSGMKAAMNGVLNLSILDGWWCDAYEPDTGWAIGSDELYANGGEQDYIESELLYNILEREIIPAFYTRDRSGLPRTWIAMMRASMSKIGRRFNTHRMLEDYVEIAYLPAHTACVTLRADSGKRARELAEWRRKVAAAWPNVKLWTDEAGIDRTVQAGDDVKIRVLADIGPLSAEDVAVEVLHGIVDARGRIVKSEKTRMLPVGELDKKTAFEASMHCTRSGRYGFAVRARPTHPDLIHSFTPPLITWE